MHLTSLLPTLLLPLLTTAIPTYPGYDHPSFSLSTYGIPLHNGQCANSTYPSVRPSITDTQAAINALPGGSATCASLPDASGCNLLASSGNARLSYCGFGEPNPCTDVRDIAQVLLDVCQLGDGTVGAWSRGRSGNGVVLWHV
ncbi:hypothetical protein EX30DRAFT_340783 [Ascodesmis nigricans]|uniref:Ecp2 effector protein domain-containing protein n=1 Tax=Ascodesmis nigricans TaxID=341454 RepID=A0A4S2MXY2_9PEZI|nr:hypothetical protein EX30DRAFT_340783 [Ascodesmis nigricans]